MAAYVVAEVEVTDPVVYEEYRKLVPATIASMDQARKWYHSPEYAPALALRLKAARSKVLLVEGAA